MKPIFLDFRDETAINIFSLEISKSKQIKKQYYEGKMSQNIYAQHIDLTMRVLSAIINIIKGFEKY